MSRRNLLFEPVPPFRLDLTGWTLRRRPDNCQQVTLTLGIGLLNRLAAACGTTFGDDGTAVHAFPRPEDLVD